MKLNELSHFDDPFDAIHWETSSWTIGPTTALMTFERVWPAAEWPVWVPTVACAICVFAMSGMPLYISAQIDAAWNFDLTREESTKLWWTRFLLDLVEFVQYLRASVLVATSIIIAANSGSGIGDSGMLIGAFWCSYWIGAIAFKFGKGPISERKADFVTATTLMMVSTVGVAIVVVQQPPYTMVILCVLQAISGATGAYTTVFRDIVRKYVYHPTDLNRAITRKKFCQAVGTTCGPLLSAAAGVVVMHPNYGHVAGISVLFPVYVAVVAALFVYYPADLRPLVRTCTASAEQAYIEQGNPRQRDLMLVAYLVVLTPVTICLSCVENATVAILSTEFNYTYIQAGIFVSVSFLSYPIIDYAYDRMRKGIAEKNILRFSMVIPAMASFLLSGNLCLWIGSVRYCLWLILLADMIMFPLLQLNLGVLQGWALRYSANEGYLSASNMTLLRLGINSITRGFTPWFSRVILETGGRDYYAAAQAILLCGALLIAETRVIPFVQVMDDIKLINSKADKA